MWVATLASRSPHLLCLTLTACLISQAEASGCCCTWAKDPVTGSPYLCVGGVDAKVKVYDVSNGSLVEVRRTVGLCTRFLHY